MKKVAKQLQKFIDNQDVVKIERDVTIGEADISGIIVQKSKNFLLIHDVEEFRFNGYALLKMDHIETLHCNKFQKIYYNILKKEGILKKKSKQKLKLSNWKSVFSDLVGKDIHVIVECEDLKNPTFTIGPIVKITSKSVSVRNYDAFGKLDKIPTKINFKDITLVRFGDRYSTIFRKYLTK